MFCHHFLCFSNFAPVLVPRSFCLFSSRKPGSNFAYTVGTKAKFVPVTEPALSTGSGAFSNREHGLFHVSYVKNGTLSSSGEKFEFSWLSFKAMIINISISICLLGEHRFDPRCTFIYRYSAISEGNISSLLVYLSF